MKNDIHRFQCTLSLWRYVPSALFPNGCINFNDAISPVLINKPTANCTPLTWNEIAKRITSSTSNRKVVDQDSFFLLCKHFIFNITLLWNVQLYALPQISYFHKQYFYSTLCYESTTLNFNRCNSEMAASICMCDIYHWKWYYMV